MIVDTALIHREAEGRPIRVALVGAGASARAIALQLGTPVPGIRLVGLANRTLDRGREAFRQAGIHEFASVSTAKEANSAIAGGLPVLTDDPSVLTGCELIDLVVEATGTIEPAAGVVLSALEHGKHVVLVNAELDSLLGPILKARAERAGVVITHTDGDEPGVAMTLLRYLRSVGLCPVAAGNIKGFVDHYRTPFTQRGFAEKHGLNLAKVTSFADGTKLSMEATVLANATGFRVGKLGMYGPACKHVRELANLLPAQQMLETGIVDYSLGADPQTGAFVIVHEESPLKQHQMAYYKLGDGPFYVFYTPYHLPHVQIASTIARAVLQNDATVAPQGGVVCEVITIAKRDLRVGERLDGIGGFCSYGLIENRASARGISALPMGLSEGCILRRGVLRDEVVCFSDVEVRCAGLIESLWREQSAGPVLEPGSETQSARDGRMRAPA
jgi:predicted homoserine dehydrogenase-like protein